jgi:fibronectin type 3 domain-containing protein
MISEVAGYLIERSRTREGSFERLAALTGRERSRYVDGVDTRISGAHAPLADGERWFYRVSAFTRDGRIGSASQVADATTAALPPPPSELSALSLQPRSVPLSWDASGDPTVTGYAVYRSPSAAGPYELLTVIAGRHHTEYVDRGLGDLRVFYYQVAARRGRDGEGFASPAVRAVTKPEPLPPIRLALEASALGANALRWEPNVEPDIARYRVLRKLPNERAFRVIREIAAGETRATDDAIGADQPAHYAITAVDASGLESAPSAALEVTSAGYGLRAEAAPGGVELRFEWPAAGDYREAEILRDGLFGTRRLGSCREARYLDRSARPGRRYRYRVALLRADGGRAPISAPVEVSVPIAGSPRAQR